VRFCRDRQPHSVLHRFEQERTLCARSHAMVSYISSFLETLGILWKTLRKTARTRTTDSQDGKSTTIKFSQSVLFALQDISISIYGSYAFTKGKCHACQRRRSARSCLSIMWGQLNQPIRGVLTAADRCGGWQLGSDSAVRWAHALRPLSNPVRVTAPSRRLTNQRRRCGGVEGS
jgi:hypothetical protein